MVLQITQAGRDGTVQPLELAFDANAALVCANDRGTLYGLGDSFVERLQHLCRFMGKGQHAGL